MSKESSEAGLRFSVITLFPEIFESIFSKGIIGQANIAKTIQVDCVNPRVFTSDVHKSVDDRPYGGGDGMIMLIEPLLQSLRSLRGSEGPLPKVIYMSPQGRPLTDQRARELSTEKHLILICGRYGGVDQRLLNSYVDEELSIGDYVLSGGELAAAVVIDAVARKIPGVLGNELSSEMDSFVGSRLEEPCFTRPRDYQGQLVPEILLSGNHQKIQEWRRQMKDLVTLKKRPDLLRGQKMDLPALRKFWSELSKNDKTVLGFENFPQVPDFLEKGLP